MRAENRSYLLISLLLVCVTLAAYWQVLGADFIKRYDDADYVLDNPAVRSGLSLDGVRWAFTTFRAANWHPLTWLSHMADVQIYGLKPWGHHLTNLIFHLLNTLLLFFVLARMTGAVWKSGFVAALFAVHPLHVESVAWVAERKDVLSTFFWMLTMGAYVLYTERPGVLRYLAVFVLLALGLMAKPMLVTLPLALLLLDYWPLGRLRTQRNRNGLAWWTLLLEKLPLFALVVASSVITVIAQREGGAVSTLQQVPLGPRVGNAAVSYCLYVWKMIWPSRLAVIYPLKVLPAWQVSAAALLLAGLTAEAVFAGRRRPYAAFGWLWYLVTLVPVIGIVQVGMQAMADRYTYVPLIGLFVIAAWGAPELLERRGRAATPPVQTQRGRGRTRHPAPSKPAASTSPSLAAWAGAAIIVVLAARTWTQVGHWRDGFALFDHALSVTRENHVAHNVMGIYLRDEDRLDEAIGHFREAVRISPKDGSAHTNLGAALAAEGKLDEAVKHYEEALRINSRHAEAHNNLGTVLVTLGRLDEAERHFETALRLKPDYADAMNNQGVVLARQRRFAEAARQFREAARLRPEATSFKNLAKALIDQDKPDEAIIYLRKAIEMKPDYGDAHATLAAVLFRKGRYSEAWTEVELARRYGQPPSPQLLEQLSRKMREP